MLEMQDGLGYDWSYIAQDEPTEFALMAYTSNSSGSDTELDVIDKGYGDQLNENDSSGSELFNSVFDSCLSDEDDNQTNDRFKKDNEHHVVPPPLIGNYMPPLADLSLSGLDDSVYRPIVNKTSASVSQVKTSITPPNNTSIEMLRVEFVRPSEIIIEDWVSDDDDIFQSEDSKITVKPSFKKIEFTKARNEPVKYDKQAVTPRMVTQSPKVDRKDWNGKMTKKLGLGMFDRGCSKCYDSGTKPFLLDYQDIDGGLLAIGGSTRGGKITGGLSRKQLNHKVKVIRYDNGTEFKNKELNGFCGQKGIKREYSVARTPQQNGVAERKNRT
ncbi:putative ribonuclease H-like domain-containing protein [Tanacetum coccineum]